ncbi:polysaccharide pyruvyl transferase family protein [Geofilum rubicundum]|uniref:Polysaccharide pyruvyl transferase domain-containing protein n=1 Tax=Geofilum rubicundum JCM 15548 TaxID=1236989 RepID=A0A0E9M2V9_9BACT|nr:polysaccharide pyruvyl transferase family protein [Geofilum rubicundum]GAO31475.1 hypothetical protein JCM15548_13839 [Geofilum rubicundum JCM 15548]
MAKNIIVLGINPFSGNRGVGALAYSTLFLLDKISKDTGTSFNICIVGKSKRIVQGSICVGDSIIRFTQFPFLVDKGIKGTIKFAFSFLLSHNIINNTNFVLDIGEGDSFSDIYGEQRFININTPKKLFRLLGKKIMLLPQTIGPFKNVLLAKEAKKSIEKSSVVMARDRLSYDYVINNTLQKRVKELTDMAFFMPYTKRVFSNGKINVGLNISSLMWHGGYTKNNQFGFKVDYAQLMRAVIDYFFSQQNVQIHLVPHVLDLNSHIENDYEVALSIEEEYNTDRITIAPFFLDPVQAKNFISGLDFFTGARMHACIAAFSSGVPVYPVAYSRKFNGLFVESLDYSFMGDLINQDEKQFLDGLKYSFENRGHLVDKIEQSFDRIIGPKYNILMEELKIFLEV